MSKLSTFLEKILKNNGGTPQDWKDLSSTINSRPDEARNFVNEIKQFIKENPIQIQLIALDLIDYIVVECNLPLHTQISSKDFITFLLTLLKTKDSPDVQFKILILIKKWGIRFESKRDVLPNFYETFNSLKNNKVVFPENVESTYYQYLNRVDSSGASNNINEPSSFPDFSNFSISKEKEVKQSNNKIGNPNSEMNFPSSKSIIHHEKKQEEEKNLMNNYGNVRLDLNPENYPKKYRKFVGELETLLNYIILSNEMIDNSDYKISVDEATREIVATVRDLDRNLQVAIENQIDNESLLAICLGINDDIIKLFKRYEELKSKKKPEPFLSSFHTDYIMYNLNYQENISGTKNLNTNNISQPLPQKSQNENLMDFGFSGDKKLDVHSQPNQMNISNNKISDINDIFDSLNK